MIGLCKWCGKLFETTEEDAFSPECRCSFCWFAEPKASERRSERRQGGLEVAEGPGVFSGQQPQGRGPGGA